MKRLYTFTLLVLIGIAIHAQTFVCTDVSFYDSGLSDRRIQERKQEALGSKATLSFFDKSLKITTTDSDGDVDSVVLDKVSDNEYRAVLKRGQQNEERLEIKLSKLFEYIRSFTIKFYKGNRLNVEATYKRD